MFFAIGIFCTYDVDKYNSRVKLELKVYATCNNHYMPLLANLTENCYTNLVGGCCQLHSIGGWTSFVNLAWCQLTFNCNFDYAWNMLIGDFS